MQNPQLSVVATSRNDDHGGNLLYRMQHFVSGFIQQCQRHQLYAELILVEWNFLEDRLSLAEQLKFPTSDYCLVRIIRIPKETHDIWANADKLPLFQMIAKNVGIRRAKGKFVLATNIDVLFSDELMIYLRDQLRPGKLYRVDRLDIPMELPENGSFQEILDYCRANYFRINGRYGTKIKFKNKWVLEKKFVKQSPNFLNGFWVKQYVFCKLILKFIYLILINKITAKQRDSVLHTIISKCERFLYLSRKIYKNKYIRNWHTNACGDFTLLAYEDWFKLRGYPEWPIYSWHLDSVFLYQSRSNNIKKKILPKRMSIYHIEHGKGSGYTPEAPELLFKRLEKNGIPYIDYSIYLKIIQQMPKKKKWTYNEENWGLADLHLEEVMPNQVNPVESA